MIPEPRDWESLYGKNLWPDRAIYTNDLDGKVKLTLIIDKGNNRALTSDRAMMVRLLEAVGVDIKLAHGGYLMTLDEFNKGAGYKVIASGRSMQQVYNARNEIKNLELMLANTPETDILYDQLRIQIAGKRRLLDAVDHPVAEPTPTISNAQRDLKFRMAMGELIVNLRKEGATEERISEVLKDERRKYEESL